ncbi:SDR family oxidoreductase [Notoacmeibacter ruber]|uniref:SDR family oxidoreductase n=1 Tax=Notoacmeibacter ruber TaxID=2670375 RepID=A0A3L7J407_9HYPH|nr:SDR family oxidoreductase [Notoacmeibacter ruber]RLQ85307.1 SDR family oxidoreductase [Notoacmeibacter ruber]
MRVFLTGATGFVGSAIVPELIGAGHEVLGLARSDAAAETLASAGAEAHRGDLTDADSLREGARLCDAVIHAAFEHDFANMAAACETDQRAIDAIGDELAGSGKRFVVTSGLPPLFGQVATEDDVPPADGGGMPRRSEQTAMALIERGVAAMVIRMSQVHDRAKQGFATYLLDHAREKSVSAYVEDGASRWPAVHRLDAARLYRSVLDEGIAGQRYHAVCEEGVPVRAIAEAIGDRLSVPVTALSADEAESHFGWLARIATMDVPASSTFTQDSLGWSPSDTNGFLGDIEASL